jgi:hypothetical protein
MVEEDGNGKNLRQRGRKAAEGVGAESCDQPALKTACTHGEGEKQQLRSSYMVEDASAQDVPLRPP